LVDRSRSSSNNNIDDQIKKNDKVLKNVIDNSRKDFGELRSKERGDLLQLVQEQFDRSIKLYQEYSKKGNEFNAKMSYRDAVRANEILKDLRRRPINL
jgi:hypothetical protein